MWYHRLSHLQSRLQNLLKGGITCQALQQPNFKSLFPIAIHWHHTASKSLNCVWQQLEDHFGPDGHVTRYELDWLMKNSYEGQKQKVIQPRILWNAEIYQQAQVPSIDFQSFLETNEGLKNFLQNFLLYGIAFVENVPATQEHTEKLAERISLIRETIYGRMWYFTSDFSRGDTAYTKLALDRHTDTTYFQEPCGIQVFHCLKHEGTGGRTLLVDGFYAAEQVLQKAPEQFELLSKVPLKHEYIENVGECHNHMIGVGPVLNIYPWNKELYLIR
ncbi:trimethyllysine hydroxylase, epsilon, transcript variant X3 [Ictidomys tridecemlineatus]|nr:trimethyllysine hydroxylase, epsilon, transcript variant X3 [Ictidomys tridecemlineatus]